MTTKNSSGINFIFSSGQRHALRPENSDRRFMALPSARPASDKQQPDFRRAAADLAGQLQVAASTAMTLASELDAAGKIMQAMLAHLTVAQKRHISIDLETRGIISDGMTRHHERDAALALAKSRMSNNWGAK